MVLETTIKVSRRVLNLLKANKEENESYNDYISRRIREVREG